MDLSSVFEWMTAAAFGGLAIWALQDWTRHRERGRRHIAAAATLLAVSATLNLLSWPLVQVFATLTFLGAGYAFLLLRDFLLPLSAPQRRAAWVSVPLATSAGIYLALAPPPTPPVPYAVAALLYLGVWLACVGEPVVRFWLVARNRPAVQRARLRALSTGYAAAILVLLLQFLDLGLSLPAALEMMFQASALLIVPILAAGLAPPAWLRHWWGAGEQEAATRGTQELLNSGPGFNELARRGLEWSARLVGADQGFLSDCHGGVLATYNIDLAAAHALAAAQSATDRAMTPARATVHLSLGHEGCLLLVAGPFTPVFGSDEVLRLEQYCVGLTAALQRERLAQELRGNAQLVEQLNQVLERRVRERTRELQLTTQRTETILAAIVSAVVTATRDGRILAGNRAADEMFGLESSVIAGGILLTDLVDPASAPALGADMQRLRERDGRRDGFTAATGRSRDGSVFAMEYRLDLVDTDGEQLLILCAHDTSERARYIEQLEYQALHDPLTGLANRALFDDRVRQAIHICERSGGSCAVLIVDLDRFKEVNDALGHSAGDALLQQVAERFRGRVRPDDTLARLGADEFGLLLVNEHNGAARLMARRLAKSLHDAIHIDERRVHVAASVGIASYPRHAHTPDALLQRAAAAMYSAKRDGVAMATYSDRRDVDRPLRITVQGDLTTAIERGELLLHFQPIVQVWSGDLSGLEALVRWQHPTLGMLAPDRFIPALEESGLIQQLSIWVVRNAIAALESCRGAGLDLVMSANVSPRCLVDGRIPELVREELATRKIPANRLRLELTETAAVTDVSEAALSDLRAMGVLFAIDDFGTGHSSLTRLRHLPVGEVKVDRSFVAGLGVRPEDDAIVRSTINLAHSLGVEVVAEGVETPQILERLVDMGCDLAQGHLIARPMPLPDIFSWNDARRRTLATPLREAS